ncbi:hypothetical protein ACO2TI_14485 [Caldimonas sp. KR1-144]
MMDQRFVKTSAGQEEIKSKSRPLTRGARNLLLMIDATRTGGEWLGLINGVEQADLQYLVSEGLLSAVVPAPQAATRREPGLPLEQALAPLSHEDLYKWLTGQAREQLGLIKGYKVILDVERCPDTQALRELATRFVAQVQELQGDEAARQLRRTLPAAA